MTRLHGSRYKRSDSAATVGEKVVSSTCEWLSICSLQEEGGYTMKEKSTVRGFYCVSPSRLDNFQSGSGMPLLKKGQNAGFSRNLIFLPFFPSHSPGVWVKKMNNCILYVRWMRGATNFSQAFLAFIFHQLCADLGQLRIPIQKFFSLHIFWITAKLSENKHAHWKFGSNSKTVEGKKSELEFVIDPRPSLVNI